MNGSRITTIFIYALLFSDAQKQLDNWWTNIDGLFLSYFMTHLNIISEVQKCCIFKYEAQRDVSAIEGGPH